MPLLIQCPDCDKQLQVPEELLGKDVQCPACRHTFVAAEPGPASNPRPRGTMALEPEPPRPKPRRYQDDDPDDDDDDLGRPIRKRPRRKPGKVQAIAIMSLIGGIFAILVAIGLGLGSTGFCCLWPGTYYSLVLGIVAIIRSSALLGSDAQLEKPPTGLAIMHMVNIINGDVTNLILGIVIMVFCSDDEVSEYLAK